MACWENRPYQAAVGGGMAKAQGSDTNLFLFYFTAGNLPVLRD